MEARKLRIAGESEKALPRRLGFTLPVLTAAKCQAGKNRVWLYDTKMPGLALMVTQTGAKSFYYVKKYHGQLTREYLGGFPGLHLDDARDAAAKKAGGVAMGIDPAAQRRASRAQMTLGELFHHYLETHAKIHKRHWEEDEAQFNRYLTGWKGRKIGVIHRTDVQTLHAKIGKDHGQHAANRLIALLHKMFNMAADFGVEKNPAHGIQKFRETSRARFVGADEMPRLLRAIEAEVDPFNDFFKLALLTGARRSNLQSMRWDEISMDAKTWTIPGLKAKGHESIVVPLVDAALVILKARLAARDEKAAATGFDPSPWVFPSHGATGHITEPKKAWKNVLTRAKITDLRLHDLRRTMGSWQAAQGASLQVIGKSLGHRNTATTAIYSRLNLDPVRASVNLAATAMLTAGENPPEAPKPT